MNQIWHQNYEQNIEDSSFICDGERAIEYSFRDNYSQRNKYSTLAMNLSEKVEGKDSTLRAATLIGEYQSSQTGKPRIDLNVALMASLAVTDSVLGPKTCTALETQLKDLLVQHEAFLRNAEVETSNDVIRLIEERDLLINERNPPTGMVSKIKNWVIGLRISFKNRAAKAKTRAYLLRRHLENVASRYQVATQEAVNPSIGWYNFQVSRINIDAARKNLLSLQEIGGSLGMNELSVKELLKKGNVQSYSVGNNELVKRLELDRVLGQFPINGFKKYPA